jgi:hypothetical protein
VSRVPFGFKENRKQMRAIGGAGRSKQTGCCGGARAAKLPVGKISYATIQTGSPRSNGAIKPRHGYFLRAAPCHNVNGPDSLALC